MRPGQARRTCPIAWRTGNLPVIVHLAVTARRLPTCLDLGRAGFHCGYGNGRVGISTNHTLALVNRGGATYAELMALGCEIASGVHDRFGIALHPESVLVGHGW
jgi:hypothetical protein